MAAVDPDLSETGLGARALGFWTPRRLILPILVVLVTLLVFTGRSAGLVDPDYYWHLKSGELIWTLGALPEGDPFSWTFEGAPWVLHEWLFQIGLFLLHMWTGPLGIAVATIGLLALAGYLALATADRMIRRPVLSLMLLIVFGAGIAGAGAPRPQLFSMLFFAITLALVFEAKYGSRRWPLLAVPLIMVAWVNLHGGYALGIAAMVALAGLEWLNLLVQYRDRRQVALSLWLTVTAVLTVAAVVVNPDGIAHLAYPLYVAQLEASAKIIEWQSIMTSPWRGPWYALGGVVFFAIAFRRGWPVDLTEILFPAALFIAGALQARHAPFATIAMTVFAAPALWRQDGSPPRAGPRLAQGIGWIVAVAALAVPLTLGRSNYFRAVDQIMPSDVATYLTRAELPGRLFNDYAIGGYLIWALPEGQKVFIDGRADLYGDAFFHAYTDTVNGTVPLSRHFDGWEIGHAVLAHAHPLKHMLLLRGDYRLVFEGRTHAVLVRKDQGQATGTGS